MTPNNMRDSEHRTKSSGQSFASRVVAMAAFMAVALPTSLALGAAWEAGNERAAEDMRERLTDNQRAVIETAIEQDQCGMLHPKMSGLCFRVQRGDMTLTPQ